MRMRVGWSRPELFTFGVCLPGFFGVAASFQGNSQIGSQIGIRGSERNRQAESRGRIIEAFCIQECYGKIGLCFQVFWDLLRQRSEIPRWPRVSDFAEQARPRD